jgi:hypothetical protein
MISELGLSKFRISKSGWRQAMLYVVSLLVYPSLSVALTCCIDISYSPENIAS